MIHPSDPPSVPDPDSVGELTALDLAHRLKNVFAVVGAVLTLSARGKPEMRPFIAELRDRIAALEVAHSYLEEGAPTSKESEERTVMGLLRHLIAPFCGEEASAITIRGQDSAMTWQLGATIALIMRELATNAVKYGALSTDSGHVEVACSEDSGRYVIHWREIGGPAVLAAPKRQGYGTYLIDRVAAPAGFSVERTWRAGGLEAVIAIPLERLKSTGA
jgi:two-component sensor histidine kinase